MNQEILFIYNVESDGEICVVIAASEEVANGYISFPLEKRTKKLGVVTADVIDKIKPGIVVRQWKDII